MTSGWNRVNSRGSGDLLVGHGLRWTCLTESYLPDRRTLDKKPGVIWRYRGEGFVGRICQRVTEGMVVVNRNRGFIQIPVVTSTG